MLPDRRAAASARGGHPGLSEIKAADQTLLDRTSLMLLSSFIDGNAHGRAENPLLLVGGGKSYPPGRGFDFMGNPDRELSRLYRRILQSHDLQGRRHRPAGYGVDSLRPLRWACG